MKYLTSAVKEVRPKSKISFKRYLIKCIPVLAVYVGLWVIFTPEMIGTHKAIGRFIHHRQKIRRYKMMRVTRGDTFTCLVEGFECVGDTAKSCVDGVRDVLGWMNIKL